MSDMEAPDPSNRKRHVDNMVCSFRACAYNGQQALHECWECKGAWCHHLCQIKEEEALGQESMVRICLACVYKKAGREPPKITPTTIGVAATPMIGVAAPTSAFAEVLQATEEEEARDGQTSVKNSLPSNEWYDIGWEEPDLTACVTVTDVRVAVQEWAKPYGFKPVQKSVENGVRITLVCSCKGRTISSQGDASLPPAERRRRAISLALPGEQKCPFQ